MAKAELLDQAEPPTVPVKADVVSQEQGLALVVQRLAENPQVDVVKLEKIIELQERIMRHNAEAAFNASFARMQPDIPEIDERGKILVKGQLRSTYALLEDIHKVIKPILAKHGFAIRHRTEWPEDRKGIIRIVGILSHEQGHSEESVFEAPMDKSEYRTDIQSMGSTVSYGRRYTTLDLLNIATRGQDKDGQRKESKPERAEAPTGYDDWLTDLSSVADNGWAAFSDTFNKSRDDYKKHLQATAPDTWETLKRKAAKAAGGAR